MAGARVRELASSTDFDGTAKWRRDARSATLAQAPDALTDIHDCTLTFYLLQKACLSWCLLMSDKKVVCRLHQKDGSFCSLSQTSSDGK